MILYKVEDLFRTDAINNKQRAVMRTMDAIYIYSSNGHKQSSVNG